MDIDELKNLGPRERLARLKKLKEDRKKELEKADKMIDDSEWEISVDEELKHIPIPQVKAVDIDSLFSAAEKEVFKAKRFVSDTPGEAEVEQVQEDIALEDTVLKEAESKALVGGGVQYGDALDQAKSLSDKAAALAGAYDTVKSMTSAIANNEYLSSAQYERFQSYAELAQELYMNGFSGTTPEEEDLLTRTDRLIYQARL